MFGVQIVPEGALPRNLPHITVNIGSSKSSRRKRSNSLVSLDELIADARYAARLTISSSLISILLDWLNLICFPDTQGVSTESQRVSSLSAASAL